MDSVDLSDTVPVEQSVSALCMQPGDVEFAPNERLSHYLLVAAGWTHELAFNRWRTPDGRLLSEEMLTQMLNDCGPIKTINYLTMLRALQA